MTNPTSKKKPRISVDELAKQLLLARYPVTTDFVLAGAGNEAANGWRRVARRAMRLLRPELTIKLDRDARTALRKALRSMMHGGL